MLRFIPALIVMGASILIGCSLSARLGSRSEVLGRYFALLDTAADRISYTGDNLAAVFSDNFAGYRFDPSRPFYQQWDEMTQPYRGVLNADDRALLGDFARGAGYGDMEAELNHIRLYQSLLKERMTDAQAAYQKKGSLYRILPFSVGLAVTILIL